MSDKKIGKRVTVKIVFVSKEGERRMHKRGLCTGKLCPLKARR